MEFSILESHVFEDESEVHGKVGNFWKSKSDYEVELPLKTHQTPSQSQYTEAMVKDKPSV